MPDAKYSALLFRAVAALAVVLAFFLTLVVPLHMRESADWSFYYAAQNFAAGHLSVDDATIQSQVSEAAQYGATLGQYVQVGERWALTEAPGYLFYLLPFYLIHAPELGNFVLAAGMAAAAYLLLKRLKGERAACLGVALLVFTPVAMAMMQRAYADTFAAAAFLSMGGGLYIYHCLSRQELAPGRSMLILFLSGLALGMAVFVNYLNALAVSAFLLHMAYTIVWGPASGRSRQSLLPALCLLAGMAIPLAGLMAYQAAVFGSPWTVGLGYARLAVGFGGRYWLDNFKYVTVALLVGFPLLLPAFAALLTAGYRRAYSRISGERVTAADAMPELPGDILLLLAGWIAAVYGLYSFYEWTSTGQVTGMPFITMARFYLPMALPLTVLAVLWIERVPRRLALGVAVLALVWGVTFFAQAALSYPVVPAKSPYNPTVSSVALPQDGPMLRVTPSDSSGEGTA